MANDYRIKAVERATNRTWDDWLKFMDGIGAKNLSHHEIATKVLEELDGKLENVGWWAQSVTVAYEQYTGHRIPGQRPDGTFQTSVSKATKLTMQDLMDKWEQFAANDAEVLAVVAGDVRVSGTENRITWRTRAHDGSDIRITSEPKKDGTASIIAVQMGLQTNELNLEAKSKWAEILQRFLETLLIRLNSNERKVATNRRVFAFSRTAASPYHPKSIVRGRSPYTLSNYSFHRIISAYGLVPRQPHPRKHPFQRHRHNCHDDPARQRRPKTLQMERFFA